MPTPDRKPKPEAVEWNTELHAPPAVVDIHLAGLQEIDKVVGNELTLDERETARLRRILFAALNEQYNRLRTPSPNDSTPIPAEARDAADRIERSYPIEEWAVEAYAAGRAAQGCCQAAVDSEGVAHSPGCHYLAGLADAGRPAPADPVADEVIRAALAWRKGWLNLSRGPAPGTASADLIAAADAYVAARDGDRSELGEGATHQ